MPAARARSAGDAPDPLVRDTHPAPSPRRLHVLHVSGATAGDLAIQTLDYLRDQVDRGWTVTLACPSQGDLGYAARESGARVRWWTPPVGRPRRHDTGPPVGLGARPAGLLVAGRRLRRLVDHVGPDVVHLHGAQAGLVGRLVLRNRVPTVYQPHGRAFRAAGETTAHRHQVLWERWASRWTTELVCLTPAELDLARDLDATPPGSTAGTDGEAVVVIDRGVDVTRWHARGPDDRVRARVQIEEPDGPLAVYVGRWRSPTSSDLVGAWADVRRRVPGARLVLVGEGGGRAHLETAALARPGVRLVGARSDLATWMAAADVVVVPAPDVATPVTALQAMATARSVILTGAATAADGLPDGVGALVAPGDTAALTALLEDRLADPTRADEEGWRSRRYVETQRDSAGTSRELARIYPRLVAARR